jgi:hypothetical protein
VRASFAGNDNYGMKYADKTIAIGKANVYAVANSYSRQYSDPNPTLDGTVTGLIWATRSRLGSPRPPRPRALRVRIRLRRSSPAPG